MKDLNHYKALHYKLLLEYDAADDVYYGRFPELPGCVADGKTEQQALEVALKVKDEWLSATHEAGWEIPEPSIGEESTGRVTLRMPKYLHRKVIEAAEKEGISQNQLILTYIAEGIQGSSKEDSLKIIAQKQDEIIKRLENRKGSESAQASSASFRGFLNSSYIYRLPTIEPTSIPWQSGDANLYSNLPTYEWAEATAVVTYSDTGIATKQREGLRLVKKQRVDDASEEDYQGGGHLHEAKSGA